MLRMADLRSASCAPRGVQDMVFVDANDIVKPFNAATLKTRMEAVFPG
jgi:hypothetical protein